MKYQELRPHFFSMVGSWRILRVGGGVVGPHDIPIMGGGIRCPHVIF